MSLWDVPVVNGSKPFTVDAPAQNWQKRNLYPAINVSHWDITVPFGVQYSGMTLYLQYQGTSVYANRWVDVQIRDENNSLVWNYVTQGFNRGQIMIALLMSGADGYDVPDTLNGNVCSVVPLPHVMYAGWVIHIFQAGHQAGDSFSLSGWVYEIPAAGR